MQENGVARKMRKLASIGPETVITIFVLGIAVSIFYGSLFRGTAQAADFGTFNELVEYTIPNLEDGDIDQIGTFGVDKGFYLFGFNHNQPSIKTKYGTVRRPNSVALCGSTNACLCICDKECNVVEHEAACRQIPQIDNFYMSFGDGSENNDGSKIDAFHYYLAYKGNDRKAAIDVSKEGPNIIFEPSN